MPDNLYNDERCPLCHGDNGCRVPKGHLYKGPCWCESLIVPGALLKRLSEEWVDPACICRSCLGMIIEVTRQSEGLDTAIREIRRRSSDSTAPLQPEDYYLDPDGKMVFNASYHLKRDNCCDSGCRHCPY
jgi:Family of unknown function (DUF5522)/Cysteine-rich CWC